MIAAEYIARFIPNAGPAPVAMPMPLSPESKRLAAADASSDFARILRTCRPCPHYSPAGHTCTACDTCGGGSVKLLWASRRGCPISKWNPSS